MKIFFAVKCSYLPSRHSPALEFKLKKLYFVHSLNKTKQPFTVFVSLGQFAKKNFENLTLENTK